VEWGKTLKFNRFFISSPKVTLEWRKIGKAKTGKKNQTPAIPRKAPRKSGAMAQNSPFKIRPWLRIFCECCCGY
jgi:hypothetical protein